MGGGVPNSTLNLRVNYGEGQTVFGNSYNIINPPPTIGRRQILHLVDNMNNIIIIIKLYNNDNNVHKSSILY